MRRGLQKARGVRLPTTEFRSSFTAPEGLSASDVIMGKIVGVDLVNHTVDVVSQFDQVTLLQIPLGSPYAHYNRGEGLTIIPDLGAKCAVCWPGDSSPPFVLSFVMPLEVVPFSGDDSSPAGTSPRGSDKQSPSAASFAGGRPAGKYGDIMLTGRDGQFVKLHRGGVLQIGSTELAQRVYVPLNNLVTDFSENYEMHNSGGTIRWGIQEGGSTTLPVENSQTFRVFANEKYADLRVSVGRVTHPVSDTDNDANAEQTYAGVGSSDPIVYELVLAKNGFSAEDNSSTPDTASKVKLRFTFDRTGNTLVKIGGSLGVLCKKKVRLRVQGEFTVNADESMHLRVGADANIDVGGMLDVSAGTVRFNGGKSPAAHVGSAIQAVLPLQLLIASPIPPYFSTITPDLLNIAGSVVTGNPTVLL